MNEDEARQALTDIESFIPNAETNWIDIQMQHIRSKGDGYWVRPFATEYLKNIEADIIIG